MQRCGGRPCLGPWEAAGLAATTYNLLWSLGPAIGRHPRPTLGHRSAAPQRCRLTSLWRRPGARGRRGAGSGLSQSHSSAPRPVTRVLAQQRWP